MVAEAEFSKELSSEEKGAFVKSLRKKAGVSNVRANISLVLIISFIAVGIYIFLDAGSIAIRELRPIETIRLAPENGGIDLSKEVGKENG